MAKVQQIIYEMEEGRAAPWLRAGALMVVVAAIAFWLTISQFRGFSAPEAMDEAQVARQLATGHGFTTQCVRPLALAQLRDHVFLREGGILASPYSAPPIAQDFLHVPDTFNPPVYPLVLAGLFKITRVHFHIAPQKIGLFHLYAPEVFINIFNQICLALTAMTVFMLGRSLFDKRVGWTAAAVCLMGDLAWHYSLSGLPVSWTMLLLMLASLNLHRALKMEEESVQVFLPAWPWGSLLLAGLLLGVATLSEYAVAWLLLPFLGAVYFGFRDRWKTIGLLIALWALLFTPWAMRNAALTGDILGSNTMLLASNSTSYPGSLLERSYRLKPGILIWMEGFHKGVHGFRFHIENFFRLMGSSISAPFFLVGLLYFFRRRRAQVLRAFTLVGVAVLVFGAALTNEEQEAAKLSNFPFLLWPLVVVFGTAFFFVLLDRFDIPGTLRPWVIGIFLVANGLPFGMTMMGGNKVSFAYPPYYPPVFFYASTLFEPNETIAADMPWAVAWYEDRPALWLPATQKDFLEINDYVVPVEGLFFTPFSRNAKNLFEIEKGEWRDWSPIIRGEAIPHGLPLQAALALPPNGNDYIIVADHVRWPTTNNSNNVLQ